MLPMSGNESTQGRELRQKASDLEAVPSSKAFDGFLAEHSGEERKRVASGFEAMEAEYRRQLYEDVRRHGTQLADAEMDVATHRQWSARVSEFEQMLVTSIKVHLKTELTEFANTITKNFLQEFGRLQNQLERATRADVADELQGVRPPKPPERMQAASASFGEGNKVFLSPDDQTFQAPELVDEQTLQALETLQAEPIMSHGEAGGSNTRQSQIIGVDVTYDNKEGQDTANKLSKLSLAEDQDLDVSNVILKESQAFGNIFQVDTDLVTIPYNVEGLYADGWLKNVIVSASFSYATFSVIISNVIYLAIEADMNDAMNLYEADWEFVAAEQFFCVYFTMEVVLRFMAFVNKRDCLRDGWFKFDLFLVGTMILEIWMLMPILHVIRQKGGGSTKFQVPTQPLRVVRLLKLARMARLMRAIPELVTMINALFQALRAIFSTMVLVLLMVYAWSIFILMFMKDEDEYNAHLKREYSLHFDGFLPCMWSLLIAGTLMLDNTGLVMTELMFSGNPVHILTGIAFITYSFLSALLVLQMLIGVLCDVVSHVAQDRRDSDAIGLIKQELLGELMKKDNGDGKITREELLLVFESESSKAVFKRLNINRLFLSSIASLMYRDSSTVVSIKTILELMIMCKGDNAATVQIIASALCFLSDEIAHLHDNMHLNFKYLNGNVPEPEQSHHTFAAPELQEDFQVEEFTSKHTFFDRMQEKLFHKQRSQPSMDQRSQ